MIKEIIINSSSNQTRVAITEDGNLVDFFVDYPENRRMVGDIYLGKIARVLPGIRAAFINIGMKHDAFLHFSDIGERTQQLQSMLDEEDREIDDEDDDETDNRSSAANGENNHHTFPPRLKKGQNILVQITKEPIEGKGVRVTSSISLPGRFCVLLPYDYKIGISKKITDFKERRRLKHIARSIIPKNCGLIIRTVAKDQPEELLREDLNHLVRTWNRIQQAAKTEEPPALIHQDLSTTESVIRDLLTPDVSKVFIDSKKLYRQIKNFVQDFQPELAEKIELYKSQQPIFEAFKIEEQIKTLMGRKVPLPSGGYLIIEHTEAMVVIDVNSGKYARNLEQELNSLKTDLEAAREIARQLRLRDIGGIIVVDFIDLEDERNKKKVYDELKKEFRKDRAKVSLLPMSDFGLVEITRQRVRQNIMQAIKDVCPVCGGSGFVTKGSHLIYDLEKWLKKFRLNSKEFSLVIKCHPADAARLKGGKLGLLTKLQLKYFVKIKLEEDLTVPVGSFRFFSKKNGNDLTDLYK
jgi:ribonuclease G